MACLPNNGGQGRLEEAVILHHGQWTSRPDAMQGIKEIRDQAKQETQQTRDLQRAASEGISKKSIFLKESELFNV
jgi:hypothetical protein